MRPACQGRRRVREDRWSHSLSELGEGCREAERRCGVGREFVVAAAEVLHERVAGGDPGG